MFTRPRTIREISLCLVLSIVAHILFARAVRLFGSYEFASPVNRPQAVMVDLSYPGANLSAAPVRETVARRADRSATKAPAEPAGPARGPADRSVSASPASPEPLRPEPVSDALHAPAKSIPPATEPVAPVPPPAGGTTPSTPLRPGGAFLTAQYERLTFQVLMFEIPIGTAELESKYENGETSITLRLRSNAAISSFYPVDDLVETRHVGSGFIMTKIRQREGGFRSDELFTINPGKKRVSWIDNLSGRSLQTVVPTSEVLDTLSALYYFRNRQVEVGRTETLHIFDSETYAEVPVEILAREEMRLPNLTKVNTLVVRPLQRTAGIFRRTGDLLIWLTDDNNKVPVKIVTSIPLGTVTAELVSAESKPHPPSLAGKQSEGGTDR